MLVEGNAAGSAKASVAYPSYSVDPAASGVLVRGNSLDGDAYSYLEPVDCAHAVQK